MNQRFALPFTTLFAFSCHSESKPNPIDEPIVSDAELLVTSIEHSRNDGENTWSFKDDYEYDGNKLIRRTETNLETGLARTLNYVYANNLITTVTSHDENNALISEIAINYDESNRIISYNALDYSNEHSPTSWTAKFSYEGNQVLHCDGQSWSSVEYKDVYDDVFVYTTNTNGELVDIERIADCYFSASPTISGLDATLEYDDNPAPFANIEGNNFILNTVIGIFTKAVMPGVYNNATQLAGFRDAAPENQTWSFEYNEFGYPKNSQWNVNDREWENVALDYQEVTD